MARGFTAESIHKDMYPATYNFKDDADGAFPSGWVDQDGVDTATTVIASYQSHRKVLQMADNSAANSAEATVAITQGLDTTIELWVAKSSVAANTDFELRLHEDATRIIRIIFSVDDMKYVNGGLNDIKLNFMVADTFVHIKLILDDTANTFDCYIDGILEGSGLGYDNASTSGLNKLILRTNEADTGYICYFEAIGWDTDTSYNIGDNVHWRHLKESTDSFEGDDVGTQGTSITWVDEVDTAASVEIIPFFSEHKKTVRQYYSSAAGGDDSSYHYFASQAKDGWFEFWIRVTSVTAAMDVNLYEGATLITSFRISASQFQKRAGVPYSPISGAPTPVVDTWYHVVLIWSDAATDLIDCWIDNVFYEQYTAIDNQTSGIDRVSLVSNSATEFMYIDAPISSLDSDTRADNRTFDYLDYTKTDITDDVTYAKRTSVFYQPFTFTFKALTDYYFDEVFFQFLDINSKLAFTGEMKNRIQSGKVRSYPCRDLSWDDYQEPINTAFSADDIHDPTDPTSMLKVALPNVSHIDGDLLLSTADTKTDTYSPTLKNYPTSKFLQDIADIADSNIVRYANGVIILDDDLASGISLDVDTAADKTKMSTPPLVNNIIESFNYFEIFGAINPDTGERFSKTIDNSGSDKKHKYRYINNNFRNQTDVDAYAAKIASRVVTALQVSQNIQDLGALELGTTVTYKYVNGEINVPSAAYFLIGEELWLHRNLSKITISEGVLEGSKYANYYEKALENTNVFAAEIYETDINSFSVNLFEGGGATRDSTYNGIRLDAVNEEVVVWFYTSTKIDISRVITINIPYWRIDANGDTVTMEYSVQKASCAAGTLQVVTANTATTLNANAVDTLDTWDLTIASSDVDADTLYKIRLMMDEAARDASFFSAQIEYYQKRSIS